MVFSPGWRPLVADRWEPFAEPLEFEGYSWSGATFVGQVRAVRDSGGAPLATFSFTAPTVVTEDSVPVTKTTMSLTESTVEGLPMPAVAGEDIALWYDVLVTPSGGTKFRALEGPFIVHAGATQL